MPVFKTTIPLLLVFTLAFNIGTNFINVLSKSFNCELVETDIPKEVDTEDDETKGFIETDIAAINLLEYKKSHRFFNIFYALKPINKLTTPPPELV